MTKDTHLVNIYLKIHNKRTLTMDDLRYLAKYAPECFEKTCKNVVYNRPETKPIMEPGLPASPNTGTTLDQKDNTEATPPTALGQINTYQDTSAPDGQLTTDAPTEQSLIEAVLENLAKLEANALPVSNIRATEVKDLLGNLYMELLFPHNDMPSFFSMEWDTTPHFDHRA